MSHKTLAFSKVEFSDLQELVGLTEHVDDARFQEWFDFPHAIQPAEDAFLRELIDKYRLRVNSFSEEELKAHIIIPLLNQVDFFQAAFRDWYERPLHARINNVLLTGQVDFMVAKGVEKPHTPYFFIQEFRRLKGREIDPKNQLLAEMLVALTLNQSNLSRGAYVIGPLWNFVLLTRDGERYACYVSKNFDSMDIADLRQIYINLQAVKHRYCADD